MKEAIDKKHIGQALFIDLQKHLKHLTTEL